MEFYSVPRAKDVNLDRLTYPAIVMPKLDGIRATVKNGVLYGRKGLPIKNKGLQFRYGKEEYNGLDGELADAPTSNGCIQRTTSVVNSADKCADYVMFYVFDDLYCQGEYIERFISASNRISKDICYIMPHKVYCQEDLLNLEHLMLSKGYEGLIIRTGHDGFFRLKRFKDSEARIIEVIESKKNCNEAEISETGRIKRSSSKEGKIGKGEAGGFIVEANGKIFKVGKGTLCRRDAIKVWKNKEQYIGKYLKYKHMPYGQKDKPRFPTFLCFRDESDILLD